ncbi:amidase family protein [Scopulibacillus cellulosilyticus]|uniref:Amidase family protein n=1 Tax=Scopulibacillus cellulosilyticus TaxID=2665665 RepID=A0ABW2PWW2_9BACL
MKVTVNDIARLANVSQSTVSRVLNNYPQVKEATRRKVLDAIEELKFTPDSVARSMVTNKSNTIGLIVGDISNPFFAESAKIMIQRAQEMGYDIIISNTNHVDSNMDHAVQTLLSKRVDGVIISSVSRNSKTVKDLYDSGFPVILHNSTVEDTDSHYVVLDNKKGALLAMEHLVQLGHRKIAFIAGPSKYFTVDQRYAGYQEALKKYNLPFRQSFVYEGEYSQEDVYRFVKKLMVEKETPTAFFAISDQMALAIMDAAASMGLKIPEKHAHVVQKLETEGAVNIGKNNMYEFGFGITSENPFFGDIINPWDASVTAGGSSGGSAVAVAANLCMGSIGTDTAGSIRVPSSCNGVVGLKPTHDLINTNGILLSNTIDHIGPIARNVEDLAIILEAMTKKSFEKNCNTDIRGMRVGVPKLYFNERLDIHVENVYKEALRKLENLGAILIEIDIPFVEDPREIAHAICTSEVGYVHRDLIKSSLHEYSEGAKETFDKSKSMSAHAYIDGLNKRKQITSKITQLFEYVDILITPTIPVIPTEIGLKEIMLEGELESVDECLIRFTSLFNVTGHPAISIPGGLFNKTVPIGLQLIANHYREDVLIKTAYSYEQANLLDFYKKREEMMRTAVSSAR